MKNSDELRNAYNVGKIDMKSLLENRVMDIAMSDERDRLNASTYLLNRHFPVDVEQSAVTVNIDVVDVKSEILKELQ